MGERESYRKSLIVIISVASFLVIAGIVSIVLLLSYNNKKEKYYETLKKAKTYMTDMRYEEAIAEYEKALVLNDEDAKVYENLAVLYETTGNVEKAKSIASTGYKKTNNKLLSNMVTNLTVYGNSGYKISSNMQMIIKDPEHLMNKDGEKIKFKLLVSEQVLNNLYQDYVSLYGEGEFSQEDNYSVVDFESLKLYYPASLSSLDAIADYSGSPVGVEYKDLSSVFEGVDTSSGVNYDQVCEAFEEEVKIESDGDKGIYYIHTVYYGMDIRIECDAEGNVTNSQPWNMFASLTPKEETPESDDGEAVAEEESNVLLGSVTGRIKDASSGSGVGGVHLSIREGSDNKVGATVYECDTDASGNYLVELDEGNYCIQVSKSGYIDNFENVSVMRNVARTGIDIILSTELNGEIRMVLEWESTPEDLDMYLTGNTNSGTSINVNYQNMKDYDGSGNCIAELDVDDTNGNGPETITLHDINGVYNLSIQDYHSTGTMANTNVRVTIYLPNNTSQTITINHNLGSTNNWNVCTIDHGKVIVKNN